MRRCPLYGVRKLLPQKGWHRTGARFMGTAAIKATLQAPTMFALPLPPIWAFAARDDA